MIFELPIFYRVLNTQRKPVTMREIVAVELTEVTEEDAPIAMEWRNEFFQGMTRWYDGSHYSKLGTIENVLSQEGEAVKEHLLRLRDRDYSSYELFNSYADTGPYLNHRNYSERYHKGIKNEWARDLALGNAAQLQRDLVIIGGQPWLRCAEPRLVMKYDDVKCVQGDVTVDLHDYIDHKSRLGFRRFPHWRNEGLCSRPDELDELIERATVHNTEIRPFEVRVYLPEAFSRDPVSESAVYLAQSILSEYDCGEIKSSSRLSLEMREAIDQLREKFNDAEDQDFDDLDEVCASAREVARYLPKSLDRLAVACVYNKDQYANRQIGGPKIGMNGPSF